MAEVRVVGGGVSGITTSLILQLKGYDVELCAKDLPHKTSLSQENESFASIWPAGAVYPVSCEKENLEEVFEISQEFFRFLWESGSMGVRRQKFEYLTEEDFDTPSFRSSLDNYEELNGQDSRISDATKDSEGFRFDMFFVEMPVFFRTIFELFRDLGGTVSVEKLEKQQFVEDVDLAVNCTGLSSQQIFQDEKMKPVRGHLIHYKGGIPRTESGDIFSYFYGAPSETTKHPGVYCFPRTDKIIFGGSKIDESERSWEELNEEQLIIIDGKKIPKRIYERNSGIYSKLTGEELKKDDLVVRSGLRPCRETGVRIEKEILHDTPLIHNYGHGGSGVTISWGCAVEVLEIAKELSKPDDDRNNSAYTKNLLDITERALDNV